VVSADWLDDEEPAVADRDDELEDELEPELVVVEPELDEVAAVVPEAAPVLVAFTVQFAPSPRKAATESRAAINRDRAAAWRRRFVLPLSIANLPVRG
jgi:hypothetical protein